MLFLLETLQYASSMSCYGRKSLLNIKLISNVFGWISGECFVHGPRYHRLSSLGTRERKKVQLWQGKWLLYKNINHDLQTWIISPSHSTFFQVIFAKTSCMCYYYYGGKIHILLSYCTIYFHTNLSPHVFCFCINVCKLLNVCRIKVIYLRLDQPRESCLTQFGPWRPFKGNYDDRT